MREARQAEEDDAMRQRKPKERQCQNCGEMFLSSQWRPKFCTPQCWYAFNSRTKTRERVCKICQKQFIKQVSVLRDPNKGQYCSKKCRGVAQIEEFKDIPQKGRGNRLADQKWKIAVREKDDYTCQRCGIKEKYIHTHHVATRSRRPDLKHDVSNGKCLCNSCHIWVHHHPIESVQLGLLSDVTYELAASRDKHLRVIAARSVQP